GKPDGKLWLYVNLTDICNGSCPFCINPSVRGGKNKIDADSFRETLLKIKDFIYGVSLTGGEPMLFPELANEVIDITKEICGSHVEKDIVTNGTGFSGIINSIDVQNLDSIHLSRHMISDRENDRLFGFTTATADEISTVLRRMEDPAQIVLNCVLMAHGINTAKAVARYLEFASGLGVRNVSFIGLSRHNAFCEQNYIDPRQLNIAHDSRFHIWNEYHDHEYCSCSSGSYDAENGSIRFYYRRMGERKALYTRQLVYTADNRLLAGFSGKEIRFDS
ncbi:MAG: radical SAM protein, partial [Butyrivibrio sp.]|nr:radical SAM protein [Butyrivibrio sp.]